MLAVVIAPHGLMTTPIWSEASLSQELRTVKLLRLHVLVEYQWQNTGLCPGIIPVITAMYATTCRTPLRTARDSYPIKPLKPSAI